MLVDAQERLAPEGPARPLAQEPVERSDAERADTQPAAVLGETGFHGRSRAFCAASGEEDGDAAR